MDCATAQHLDKDEGSQMATVTLETSIKDEGWLMINDDDDRSDDGDRTHEIAQRVFRSFSESHLSVDVET